MASSVFEPLRIILPLDLACANAFRITSAKFSRTLILHEKTSFTAFLKHLLSNLQPVVATATMKGSNALHKSSDSACNHEGDEWLGGLLMCKRINCISESWSLRDFIRDVDFTFAILAKTVVTQTHYACCIPDSSNRHSIHTLGSALIPIYVYT